MKFKSIILVIFGMIITGNLFSQTLLYPNNSNYGQTYNSCNGTLYSSGGVGGYQANEHWIITICPDIVGNAVTLDFTNFNLDTTNTDDLLIIYDGNSSGSPLIGNYTGTSLQGILISASSLNPSGCLTILFQSNDTINGNFEANISCYLPCQRPTAILDNPILNFPDTVLKVCLGESISFDGTSSFAAGGFNITQYYWIFDDGNIDTLSGALTSYSYSTAGVFHAELVIIDDNNCASFNGEGIDIVVATEPSFQGTTPNASICVGESLCLEGVVVGIPFWGNQSGLDSIQYIPDFDSLCLESTILINGYNQGTLTNINQLDDICVSMEHSYIGDLKVTVICPNGQSVILYNQGGGWNSLGEPIDITGPLDPIGIPYDYCWSNNATLGTWADCGAAGITPNLINLASGAQTLAPGTYSSLNPLSGLVGCPIDGNWTLEFCDLWGADDGWLVDWKINFDSTLYSSLTPFIPSFGMGCDSTFWLADNSNSSSIITSTSIDCNSICITPDTAGIYSYTFNAIDDFGCTYTTTSTVTVTNGPTGDAGPDLIVCPNTTAQLNANIIGSGVNCNYTFNLNDSFGDGWNGANFNLYINGVLYGNYTLTGSTGTFSIMIPANATIDIEYIPGSWESEVTYEILDCNGNIVFSDGPIPATGIVYTGLNGLDMIYSWTPTTGLSDPNIANPTVIVNQQTTFYVTAHENGHPLCGMTDSVTIIMDTVFLSLSNNVMNATCDNSFDGSIDLSVTGATSPLNYLWSNSETTEDISSLQSGNYIVEVSELNGCPVFDTIFIGFDFASPIVTLSLSNNMGCDTSNIMFLDGGLPLGGTYSGIGVIGSNFDPSVAGNGMHTITYSFTDNFGCSGSAIDFIQINNCNSVNEFSESVFTISPNPTTGNLKLISNNKIIGAIIIYDAVGKIVYREYLNNIIGEINLSRIENGIYFIQIENVYIQKIIKH